MNEATTTPERRPGVDLGKGRDDKGHFTSRDPSAPPRDYEEAEAKGIRDVEKEHGVTAIRDKVRVQYEGSPQPGGRYYDAFFPNGDGTYPAIEVKSGSACDRYKNPETSTQKAFDNGVSPQNPASGIYNGQEIRITRVIP